MRLTEGATDLDIEPVAAARLRVAARDDLPVSGLTRTFYRYPARFSPIFVREAIEAFTEPDDLVFDPFMGGGTTLVEAMALGRNAAGCDISSLAAFVSKVKTTIYSDADLDAVRNWLQRAPCSINIHKAAPTDGVWAERGYLRNLGRKKTWRLTKAIRQALASVDGIGTRPGADFARCVILRTAQWALDSRKVIPLVQEFRARIRYSAAEMLDGAMAFRESVGNFPGARDTHATCLHRSAATINDDGAMDGLARPKLVLTSPPYPGVHVLYHRWPERSPGAVLDRQHVGWLGFQILHAGRLQRGRASNVL